MKKIYKYKMNPVLMNISAVILYLLIIIPLYIFYKEELFNVNISAYVILLLWFILHEVFHYLGFLINKNIDAKDLFLGMYIEKGIFYCMCKKEIDKKGILIALSFPFMFIGVITLIIGIIFNINTLIFLSTINLAASIGDILMFIQILRFPNDIKYTDIDDSTGYVIISKKNISNIKTLAIKLDKVEKYDSKKLIHKDNNRINITKSSWIFLIIYILLIIIYYILNNMV